MCGIAGFLGRKTEPAEQPQRSAVLDRMTGVMSHRGPDDQGTMLTPEVALGMRRLSIIDLESGHQPMSTADGKFTIVFNGEIYNYRELCQQLKRHGHTFKTKSDTETILYSYKEYGLDCVQHLRGMFAFAIWDAALHRLFIARDRVGEKPLYYSLTPRGTLVFGSELKCLLEHPEISPELAPEAVDAYLTFGYVPDPLSIFKAIHKLPPGHLLTFINGNVQIKQYWDFMYEPVQQLRKENEYIEELRMLLDESVRARLVADVPVGAFLSGGIDSSTVVGLMAQNMSEPVKTFSIGFREDSYDELKYARMVARRFGTDHHELIVTPEVCNVIDELLWHFDEPFADQSVIPTYLVSKLARDQVKVVLSGDGGDELFAGYTRYATDHRRRGFGLIPSFIRRTVMMPISRRLPHRTIGRNYLYNASLDPLDRYIDSISVFTNLNKAALYSEEFRSLLNGSSAIMAYQNYAQMVGTGHQIDRLLYLDSKTYLPGDILTKVDRMSMAVSLEARVPLLDHKLIELVTAIPASLKMRGNESKHVLKLAVKDLVPEAILSRPKQGFGVPIGLWINDQLRDRIRETFSEKRTRERGYVKGEYMDVLLTEHERGRRDHSQALWALLMFELWYRTFLDGRGLACARTSC